MSTELFGMETETTPVETEEARKGRELRDHINAGAQDLVNFYVKNPKAASMYNAWHRDVFMKGIHTMANCKLGPKVSVDLVYKNPMETSVNCEAICTWRDTDEAAPFVKCPHFRTVGGVHYGCSNHATTLYDVYYQFSPYAQTKEADGVTDRLPRPPPHGDAETRRLTMVACEQEWVNFYTEVKAAGLSLDKCWGRCRCCRGLVPPGDMCWPLTAANLADGLSAQRTIWGDGPRSKGNPLNPEHLYCRPSAQIMMVVQHDPMTDIKVYETFFKGCTNSAPKGQGCVKGMSGFDLGQHDHQLVCNRCGVTVPGDINYSDAGTTLDKDKKVKSESKRAEDTPDVKPNFLSGIGCAHREKLSMAACNKRWTCAEHSEYDHNCEACWACHPCDCVGARRNSLLGAIEKLMPDWEKRFYNGGRYDTDRASGDGFAPATKKLFTACYKARHRRKEVKKATAEFAPHIAAYLVPEASDDPDARYVNAARQSAEENRDITFMTNAVKARQEDNAFDWRVHCKCPAHNEEYRRNLIKEQARLTDWSVAVEVAQERWRKVLLWFYFLWGKPQARQEGEEETSPASPYLDAARDFDLFNRILLSALKNPEYYRKQHVKRSGVDGATMDTLNDFDWAILISMVVQFCRCAYVLTDDENGGVLHDRAWTEWRAPPRPGSPEFDNAVFGFVDGESDRWGWSEMVEYAMCKVADYCKNQQETANAGVANPVRYCTKAKGGGVHGGTGGKEDFTIRNFAKAIAKEAGYLSDGVHSLVAFRPFFMCPVRMQMATVGSKGVGTISGYDALSDAHKAKAKEMAMCAKTQGKDSRRKFFHGLECLDHLIRQPVGANKDHKFWTQGLPQAIREMIDPELPTDPNTEYVFNDISLDGTTAIHLTGKAADEARLYRGKSILAQQDATWRFDPAGKTRVDVAVDAPLLVASLFNGKETAAETRKRKAADREETAKYAAASKKAKAAEVKKIAAEAPGPDLEAGQGNSVRNTERREADLKKRIRKRKEAEAKAAAQGPPAKKAKTKAARNNAEAAPSS